MTSLPHDHSQCVLLPISGGVEAAAACRPAARHLSRWRTALRMRGVPHGLKALLDRLKGRGEHGCGQLGYALAIAHSGFDSFLDQPLLQFDEGF